MYLTFRKEIKTIIKLLVLLSVTLAVAVSSHHVSAFDPFEQSCANNATSAVCTGKDNPSAVNGTPTKNPVTDTIKTAINIITLVAGAAAVVIIIIGGFTFITAGSAVSGQRAGDGPKGAAKGRSMIVGAVAGLVIIALAWTIATFTVDKFIQ